MLLTTTTQLTVASYTEAAGQILKLPSEWPKIILFVWLIRVSQRESVKITLDFPLLPPLPPILDHR